MKKVLWKHTEKETVLREVARNMQTHTFSRGEFYQLLREAQNVLPADRRRPFRGSVGADLRQLEARTQKYYSELHLQPVEQTPPVPVELPPTLEERLEEIGRQIAAPIMAAFGEELLAALRQTISEAVIELRQAPSAAEKPLLPRVLVVGTKQEWDGQLRRDFVGRLNLFFFNDAKGSAGLASECRKASHIVLNGSMCRHTHQAVARASGRPMTVIHGAFSGLKAQLESLLPAKEGASC